MRFLAGSAPWPINEWVGDEYDDLLAIFEEQYKTIEKKMSKRVGKKVDSEADGDVS